jgi:NAD(P)-dependent dehydrogenase (short-subunit alcohol dehydrogenase family)
VSELRFDNRVVVITGGGRGLGRAHALLLGSRGAKVLVNDPGAAPDGSGIDAGPAAETARDVIAAGGDAIANMDSVATPEGGEKIVKAALDKWGRIDALILNAGNSRRAPLKEFTQADFDAVLQVHLLGAFHVIRPALPIMCKAGYGRIVLTGSAIGLYGNTNVTAYATAKAGMIGLCNNIAIEGAADGVKCNILLPGAVTRLARGLDTSSYPPTMDPELVSPMAAWLCHEQCSVSGEMFSSVAGRVSTAYIVESKGVFREHWSIEQIAQDMDAIRNRKETFTAPVVPRGFLDHLAYSFDMARRGLAEKK